MSTLPVMTARNTDVRNTFFDDYNVTSIDLYHSNPQPQVFQSNSSFPLDVESFQQNGTYLSEGDGWSQLFEMLKSWQNVFLVIIFCAFIVITIIGNTLVILAVITTRRLKTVTNCFVMSLAVADLLVGIFVMPPAVAVHLKAIGYGRIITLNTRTVFSKVRGTSQALYVLAAGDVSRFEFLFTDVSTENKSSSIFSPIFDIHNIYQRTFLYRELKLRSAILRSRQLILLPQEQIYSNLTGVWNLSSDQGNLGSFIVTNIRIVWYADINESFNISLPYMQISNIRIRDSKYGDALVIQTADTGGGYVLGFRIDPAERLNEIYKELVSLFVVYSETPNFGIHYDSEGNGGSAFGENKNNEEFKMDEFQEIDTAQEKEINSKLTSYLADGYATETACRQPIYSKELGFAIEQIREGSWQLGWVLCDIWISLDVLLCTASILSLCAISVDRYLAVTQPLTYSRKRRSKRLALVMILIVWTLALAITCPPMFGWYEPGRRYLNECRYNQNEGYVIFSAMGSFFIPMAVMVYVYGRISCVVASRHDNMTDINIHKNFKRYTSTQTEVDIDANLSEQDMSPSQKRQSAARTLSNQTIAKELHEVVGLDESDLITKSGSYELAASTFCTPSIKRQSSVTSKTSTSTDHHYTLSGLQRHSIRHNISTTPYINDTYITRNTRVHHQKSLSNRISLLKKENKTTQTLSIVVGGFIACWLPFFIYYLITPFLSEQQVSRNLAKVLTWLGWFNSAINPFIYAFYSVDFRAAFWRLTLKRLFRTSLKARYPPTTMSIRR